MLRAVAMAARLDFSIDPPIDAAIAAHRGEIARGAPARLIEEFYKLLRAGAAEQRVPDAGRAPAARADRAGAAEGRDRGALAVARGARRLPRPLRGRAGDADQRDPARLAARAARPHDRGRSRRRRSPDGEFRKEPRDCRSACCRWRGATSSGCARSWPAAPAGGHEPLAARAPRADAPRRRSRKR